MTVNLDPVLEKLADSYRERGCDASVATMTVVVLFDDPAIGELARERIRMLAGKHPSRVIVLDGGQSDGMHQVEGCDWIELGAKQSSAEILRAAVEALRIADAPVVLLWIALGIANDARFAMLCETAQTVVYNSSLLDGGHQALCELVDYVEQHPERSLSDIAYLRLAPWQECVAIFFDGPAAQELRDLQRVEIICGSEPEAFYLLGWLASRLQWTPCAADALRNRQGKRVTFAVRREGEPRRIARVSLSSSRSTFVAEIDKRQETILLSAGGSAKHGPRYRAINNIGIAALVERAILWGHNDQIFQAALAAAGAILAQRKG